MNFFELFLIAVGLSMDAFAVAVCSGVTISEVTVKKALVVGLYFGIFQAAMPLIGFFAASLLADKIVAYDHWIAFALLEFLGGKMVLGAFTEPPPTKREEYALKPSKMLPLAVATSIDALAVGVSFGFLQISIVPAVSLIGITTLLLSMLGVKIGNVFGSKFESKAELAGGAILMLMGAKILFEHVGVVF